MAKIRIQYRLQRKRVEVAEVTVEIEETQLHSDAEGMAYEKANDEGLFKETHIENGRGSMFGASVISKEWV